MLTVADKIALNKRYADQHGWRGPGEIIPGALEIDEAFVKLVAKRQNELHVGSDGVCGPTTYSAVLADYQKQFRAQIATATADDKLRFAGMIALDEIKRLWLRDIQDLPDPRDHRYAECQSTIDQLIRSQLGIGWSWLPPYQRDRFEFCGTGPAYGWRAAGMPLKPHRYYFFSSTDRLECWSHYHPWEEVPNPRPPAGVAPRMVIELNENSSPKDCVFPDKTVPRAGDIVIMGPCESGEGKHIGTVELYFASTGEFTTIECNGGPGTDANPARSPSGRKMHGIIRATRRIGLRKSEARTTYHIRRVIRPSIADLVLSS